MFYSILVPKINQNRLQNQRKTRLFFHICFQRVLYQFDFVWAPFWLPWSSLLASLGPIWSALWLLLAPLASILGVQRRPWPPFWASRPRSEAFLDSGSPKSTLQARFGSSLASFQAPSGDLFLHFSIHFGIDWTDQHILAFVGQHHDWKG